jgi:hypothetical protein
MHYKGLGVCHLTFWGWVITSKVPVCSAFWTPKSTVHLAPDILLTLCRSSCALLYDYCEHLTRCKRRSFKTTIHKSSKMFAKSLIISLTLAVASALDISTPTPYEIKQVSSPIAATSALCSYKEFIVYYVIKVRGGYICYHGCNRLCLAIQ